MKKQEMIKKLNELYKKENIKIPECVFIDDQIIIYTDHLSVNEINDLMNKINNITKEIYNIKYDKITKEIKELENKLGIIL